MKSTILILAIAVAFAVATANNIQNRELSDRGLIPDLLKIVSGLVGGILQCLLGLLSGVSETLLKPVLDVVLKLVKSLGLCTNVSTTNGILTVLTDLLTCLLGSVNTLTLGTLTTLLTSLLNLGPVLQGVELSDKDLLSDLLPGLNPDFIMLRSLVRGMLQCLLNLLSGVSDTRLKPVLDIVLDVVKSLGVCNAVPTVLTDLLSCLLVSLNSLTRNQLSTLLTSLLNLVPALQGVELSDKDLLSDLLPGLNPDFIMLRSLVRGMLQCLLNLLSGVSDTRLKPVLDIVLDVVKSLGVCNAVPTVLTDLLSCLLLMLHLITTTGPGHFAEWTQHRMDTTSKGIVGHIAETGHNAEIGNWTYRPKWTQRRKAKTDVTWIGNRASQPKL
ncbi:hypothetical protein FQR65_LT13495 [Abscondita terminalis]|nr:hypothetical protein FQR65_LT13495 [Abscondita terminalis]